MTPTKHIDPCKRTYCAGMAILIGIMGIAVTVYGQREEAFNKRLQCVEGLQSEVASMKATLEAVKDDVRYLRSRYDADKGKP